MRIETKRRRDEDYEETGKPVEKFNRAGVRQYLRKVVAEVEYGREGDEESFDKENYDRYDK